MVIHCHLHFVSEASWRGGEKGGDREKHKDTEKHRDRDTTHRETEIEKEEERHRDREIPKAFLGLDAMAPKILHYHIQ